MVSKEQLLLYAVTDRSWLNGETLASRVELAVRGGTTMVQLREKDMNMEDLKKEALEVQEICRKYRVPFIINDYVELAQELDADGVHIGQDDTAVERARRMLGREKIIGVTAKTIEQAKAAERAGADYLGSGAVFGSSTKKDAKPMTVELLSQICAAVNIPVAAIGGISADNVMELRGCPIAGAAVVSGIFAADDIEQACRRLRLLLQDITA